MRRFLAFLSAAILLAALVSPSAQAQTPANDKTIKAQNFLSSFGVNIHFAENDYANTQAIADALHSIGISRVRCNCENADQIASWKDIAAKTAPYFPGGLKADVLILGYLNDSATFADQQKTVPQIASLIETIEGPNEINLYEVGSGAHGPFDTTDQTKNFPANYAAWTKALYHWKKTVPALKNAKLIAPTIASGLGSDYARLPNVSPYVSAGTLHFYAGSGRQPSNFGGGDFPAVFDWYKAAASPSKPVVVSEWGQTTAFLPGQAGCDPATQAKYILNQMCDLTAKGAYRSYLYQLMDDTADGDPTGSEGTEAHFGIFDYQWHPKPAALALANLKTLLADKSTAFVPRVPRYHVSGVTNAGNAGSSLSISKSAGSTFIVVWNEPQIWDETANAPVTPPADPATVSFGGKYAYKVYDPLVGVSALSSGRSTGVTANVTGSPILVQVMAR